MNVPAVQEPILPLKEEGGGKIRVDQYSTNDKTAEKRSNVNDSGFGTTSLDVSLNTPVFEEELIEPLPKWKMDKGLFSCGIYMDTLFAQVFGNESKKKIPEFEEELLETLPNWNIDEGLFWYSIYMQILLAELLKASHAGTDEGSD